MIKDLLLNPAIGAAVTLASTITGASLATADSQPWWVNASAMSLVCFIAIVLLLRLIPAHFARAERQAADERAAMSAQQKQFSVDLSKVQTTFVESLDKLTASMQRNLESVSDRHREQMQHMWTRIDMRDKEMLKLIDRSLSTMKDYAPQEELPIVTDVQPLQPTVAPGQHVS